MSDPLYAKPLLRLAANANGAGRLNPFEAQSPARMVQSIPQHLEMIEYRIPL